MGAHGHRQFPEGTVVIAGDDEATGQPFPADDLQGGPGHGQGGLAAPQEPELPPGWPGVAAAADAEPLRIRLEDPRQQPFRKNGCHRVPIYLNGRRS